MANFCFLTKDTNLAISDRLPEEYFPEIKEKHPGALESQWIPDDPDLWKIENYPKFLEARRELLAAETNRRMAELLHGDFQWLTPTSSETVLPSFAPDNANKNETELEDDVLLKDLNSWLLTQGLCTGIVDYDFADDATGRQLAVFDIAWPSGVQENLSQPVSILFKRDSETIALASQAGFRCFTSIDDFKRYVADEMLEPEEAV